MSDGPGSLALAGVVVLVMDFGGKEIVSCSAFLCMEPSIVFSVDYIKKKDMFYFSEIFSSGLRVEGNDGAVVYLGFEKPIIGR